MLNPEWYYDDARSAFVAFADGESGCSRYDFDDDGVAIINRRSRSVDRARLRKRIERS